MLKALRWTTLALVAVVAGCTAQEQRSLDRDFVELTTLRQAARADARRLDEVHAAEQALVDLAVRAQTEAEARIKANRPEDAIAAYRVAATARWRSGAGGVEAPARDGLRICDQLKARQPARDCAFLRLVPVFAAFDSRVAELQAISNRIAAGGLAGMPAEARAAETQSASRIVGALIGYMVEVQTMALLPPEALANLPESFLAYRSANVDRMYCSALRGTFTVALLGGDAAGRQIRDGQLAAAQPRPPACNPQERQAQSLRDG